MAEKKQHVDPRRKLELRRRLLKHALPGPVYVPFLGEGDIASELYTDRDIYGVELDAERADTARGRLPGATVVTGDAEEWQFSDVDVEFSVADFDAWENPYPAIAAFLKHAKISDPCVIFGTDTRLQRIQRGKTAVAFPKGDGAGDWRKCSRYYWQGHVTPYLESVLPHPIQAQQQYRRSTVLYWGIVVGTSPIEEEKRGMGTDRRHSRRDAKFAKMAIERRWPVAYDKREPLIESLFEIAADSLNLPNARVSAARAIIAAEGQNQADEHKKQPDKVDLNLSGTAEEQLDGILSTIRDEAARKGVKLNGRA